MSGTGAPETAVDATGLRLAIIAARWHQEITDFLLASAVGTAHECGIESPTVLLAPGAVELPVIAQALAPTHDAVVCLGLVLRGGTPHFEYVCQVVAAGCMRVALDTSTPVGFGILTCDTEQQALDRCGRPGAPEDKGREATLAALATAVLLRGLAPTG